MDKSQTQEQGTVVSYRVACETGVTPQTIFGSYLRGKAFVRRPDILSPSFVPATVLHRDSEVNTLALALAPALRGYKPNNMFVYGQVGTGKTITVRYVLNELSNMASTARKHIKTIYVNCRMKRSTDTEYRLLVAILKEFGVVVPETGLSTASLYRQFFEVVKGRTVVIALDEIDMLVKKSGDEFLYNLSRAEGNISLIGITNNLNWHDGVDTRVKSSLSEEEVVFKPYNAAQLADILRVRASEALDADVDDSVINKCAALAAQQHGDARRALELLRVSAEIAERMGYAEILEENVDMADQKVNHDRILEALRGLPKQSLAVLAAVLEIRGSGSDSAKWSDKRILSSSVYARYNALVERSGLKGLTQRRVSDLINELESVGILDTRVVSKGRYGRTREISVCLDESALFKAQRVLAESGF